jgi:hypothetical protein
MHYMKRRQMQFGMSPTRWILLIFAIIVATSVVIGIVGPLVDRADAAQRTQRTVTRHGVTTTTFTVEGRAFCTQYPNGVLKGVIVRVQKNTADGGFHVWTFGPWGPTWCQNNQRLWDVDWDGIPGGHADLGWNWDGGYTRMIKNDNVGPSRFRRWKGHAHYDIAGVHRDCYPEMEVQMKAGASPGVRTLQGC